MAMKLTEFQEWSLKMCDKGAGLDASPGAITAKERRELDELVAAGRLKKSKNHSQDKHGMYTKPPPIKGDTP
jgi:hypothetical protein